LIQQWEEHSMKAWTKPAVAGVDAGFEVTRYLPSTLDVAAGRACK
jgi:coenzyme PQQ precursor peptide PqqA